MPRPINTWKPYINPSGDSVPLKLAYFCCKFCYYRPGLAGKPGLSSRWWARWPLCWPHVGGWGKSCWKYLKGPVGPPPSPHSPNRGSSSQPFNKFLILYCTLQRTENSKQIFPEKEFCGHSPNFHIYVSVSDLYIPTIDLPVLLQEICGPIQYTV